MRAGSNHESHPNPSRGATGYDTPSTSPFSRQVLATLVSVRHRRRRSDADCPLGKGRRAVAVFQPVE
jgi:hypothetical protein